MKFSEVRLIGENKNVIFTGLIKGRQDIGKYFYFTNSGIIDINGVNYGKELTIKIKNMEVKEDEKD